MFGVKSFPQLVFLHQGKMIDYNMQRNEEKILEFATEGYKEKMAEAIDMPYQMHGLELHIANFKKEFNIHFFTGVKHVIRDANKYGVQDHIPQPIKDRWNALNMV